MAAHYIQEIRSVRPKGPYLLGGTCTGGVVAYEMAQQLVGQGEQVILAIMESWHPRSHQAYRKAPPLFLRPTIYFLRKTIRSCRGTLHLPFSEWPSHWRDRIRSITNRPERRWFHLGNHEYYTDLVTSATFYAVARYQPQPYPGRLLNVIASTRPLSSSTQDTRLTWGELALQGDQTVFMPAEDSGQLFTPAHVQELAHYLVAYFNHECPEHFSQSDLAPLGNDARIEPAKP